MKIEKLLYIFLNALPVLVMIALIPLIKNDYILAAIFAFIIAVSLLIRYEKKEWRVIVFGFLVMTFFEYIFIKAGVEAFSRQSFLGAMPLWLPILWAYGFIAIGRCVKIIK